ncbi:MAG: transcriptional regulator, TetR family [Oscillospiraceae bacterium]|nr:transcriptional regulator, TetR family [Oscillospiraceae bacterium]
MAKAELTSRAKQAIETKRRIVRCAKKLVQKSGFDKVSVSQISEAAGITVGTFYYYFQSKDDLLYELLPKAIIADTPDTDSTLHSYVQLIELFRHLVSHPFQKSSELWSCIMRSTSAVETINKDRLPMVGHIISRGQRRKEIAGEVSAEYIAELIIFTNRGIFVEYVHKPHSMNYPSTAMDVIERLVYSFLTEKGRRTLPEEYRPKWERG